MSETADLDRRKLMDWVRPDIASHGRVLGLLGTTYELNATFFDSDFLPTFLGLGAWEDGSWANRIALQRALSQTDATVVIMDARRFRGRPRSLHIEVMPEIGANGAKLHAKVLLVVQERAVRMLVASANLTDNGYRYNREVALPIVATAQAPHLSALVHQALMTMKEPLEAWWTESAERVRSLALETMEKWDKSGSGREHFVWSCGKQSLAKRFVSLWPDEPIAKITIVSPFWSDEGSGGPIAQLLGQFGHSRIAGAKVRLLTEAAPETQTNFRPKVPPCLAAWDCRDLGVQGEIQAVDPQVLLAEVGGRSDYQRIRPLHAKVVVVEGTKSTLVYMGSANFTRHGWGFAGSKSNIEAGVILLRDGKDGRDFRTLIPKAIGRLVPLNGNGRDLVTPLVLSDDSDAWPTFIREIRLTPVGAENNALELRTTLGPTQAAVPFMASLVSDSDTVLLCADRLASGALEPRILEQLLRDQCVNIHWNDQCVGFPLNVTLDARFLLPTSPGSAPPGEDILLAYYQGKVAPEDIYPPLPGESEGRFDPLLPVDPEASKVDTSKIQSYQIREFVEALHGIQNNLMDARGGTEAAMRQALLGEISPTALAREVVRAFKDNKRSSTAAGFQLVEILACLSRAERSGIAEHRKDVWCDCVAQARKLVEALLDELGIKTKAFQRYRAAIRRQAIAK